MSGEIVSSVSMIVARGDNHSRWDPVALCRRGNPCRASDADELAGGRSHASLVIIIFSRYAIDDDKPLEAERTQ